MIDEKSWGGPIAGTDQSWQLRGNQLVENPLNKVEHVVRRLASHLRSNVSGFPAGGRVIGARVLLSNPSAKAQLRDPRAQDQVLTLANVVDRLTKQDAEGQSGAYLTPLHGAIEGVLYTIPARPAHPTHIEPYRIDELLKRLPGCRVYRAPPRAIAYGEWWLPGSGWVGILADLTRRCTVLEVRHGPVPDRVTARPLCRPARSQGDCI